MTDLFTIQDNLSHKPSKQVNSDLLKILDDWSDKPTKEERAFTAKRLNEWFKENKRIKFEIKAKIKTINLSSVNNKIYFSYWPNKQIAFSHWPNCVHCYNSNGKYIAKFTCKNHV